MGKGEDEIRLASHRFYEAANAVMQGDADPMLALWSHDDEATYLDPRGTLHQGSAALRIYWEAGARANRQAPGEIVATGEDMRVIAGDILGYTITREHLRKRGMDTAERILHATNIYRLEDGTWRMIHRHVEAPRDMTLGSS